MRGVADEIDAALHPHSINDDANQIVVAEFAEWTAGESFGTDVPEASAGADAAETRIGQQRDTFAERQMFERARELVSFLHACAHRADPGGLAVRPTLECHIENDGDVPAAGPTIVMWQPLYARPARENILHAIVSSPIFWDALANRQWPSTISALLVYCKSLQVAPVCRKIDSSGPKRTSRARSGRLGSDAIRDAS
jgi:hypothetical protein